ncbi:hypothetical protein H0H93_005103, partial [Arthromyces matolae]
MKQFKKGPLVYSKSVISAYAADTNIAKIWAVWEGELYDLTDYVYTQTVYPTETSFAFLNSDISDLFKQRSGQDITTPLNKVLATLDATTLAQNTACLKN